MADRGDNDELQLLRKDAGRSRGSFTLGEHSAEFSDEVLDLVDRSNVAALARAGCPVASFPPHGDERRGVHPHGVLFNAEFIATGDAERYSSALHLRKDQRSAAQVRMSNYLLPLHRPDIRGFAVKLSSEDVVWDLVGTSIRRFIASNIASFRAISTAPTVPLRKARAHRLSARAMLNGANPLALVTLFAAQARWLPGRKKRWEKSYWGVHTFWLTKPGEDDLAFKFRWRPVPDQKGTFDLCLDLIHRDWKHVDNPSRAPWTRVGPLRWQIQQTIVAGRLVVDFAGQEPDALEGDDPDDVLFLPTRVPPGVRLSDDEVLFARGGAYQLSYLRRTESLVRAPTDGVELAAGRQEAQLFSEARN